MQVLPYAQLQSREFRCVASDVPHGSTIFNAAFCTDCTVRDIREFHYPHKIFKKGCKWSTPMSYFNYLFFCMAFCMEFVGIPGSGVNAQIF